jgi:molybdate transport system regulatory protein
MPPASHSGTASVSIPDNITYLTKEELSLATDAFAAWVEEAKTPVQKRSRCRLWLSFLLIRYGGLRLGEVLGLDDQNDIQISRCMVVVRGSNPRKVLLPEQVMQNIAKLLSSPMFCSMRGDVLHLDQGYLRRKFYERARACGLPEELFNPRVIRYSRAIELVGGGVPVQVVQSFLGQNTSAMPVNYLEFSSESSQRIVQRYINREIKMRTSARNAFTGRVTGLARDNLLVEVELTTMAGLKVVAVITEGSFNSLRLQEGSIATATVKAPWVVLALGGNGASEIPTSARNTFPGTISSLKTSDIACEVVVDLAEGSKVCALVTLESVKKLHLKPGANVLVMFSTFSVIVNVE